MRTLRQVGDLTQYQSFLRVLAARSAQLVNLTDVSRDLGVAVNTIKAWLSVLEATYQVIVLRPYFANVGKRLVKTPKVYFTDVGTLCYLAGLKDPAHAASGPMGSAIMETAVLSEIFKTLTHRGIDPQIYFWRTLAGTEVDFVVEATQGWLPLRSNCPLRHDRPWLLPLRHSKETWKAWRCLDTWFIQATYVCPSAPVLPRFLSLTCSAVLLNRIGTEDSITCI